MVSNVTAVQRAGTKLVDLTYDVAAEGFSTVAIKVEASSDGGATWTVPVQTISGAVGEAVPVGTGKTVVWDAAADWAGQSSSQMRFRVTADDGFALIPGGAFTMGRTSGDTDSNAPRVSITVSDFYMQKVEVTRGLYNQVRNWAQSRGYAIEIAGGIADDHPAVSDPSAAPVLNWYYAVKWCNALSEMRGLKPCYYTNTQLTNVCRSGEPYLTNGHVDWNANGYRLPTEAEWEKAARGGVSGKRFPWGSDVIFNKTPEEGGVANYDSMMTEPYDQGPAGSTTGWPPKTRPSGSFPPNAYGLFDMAGNVSEWCWDIYTADYYIDDNIDPRGPTGPMDRVYRDGGFPGNAKSLRCCQRNSVSPGWHGGGYIGFRIARSIPLSEGSISGSDLELDLRITQEITFSSIPDKLTTDSVSLTATGGASGNPVSFAVTEGPGVIANNILTFTTSGSVTITASQAGNATYLAAPDVSRTFTVTKATAQVTLGSLTQTYLGTPRAATATTEPSGLNVEFTYEGESTPPTNAGIYAVVATINDLIYQGSATGTLEIGKDSQTITFAAIPDKLTTDSINLTATGGGSGNPVTFAVTSGPGLITNNVLTFTTSGSVTITASQAGNANYLAAEDVSRTFTVTKAVAPITFAQLTQVANGTPRPVSVSTTPSGLTVTTLYAGTPTAPSLPGSYAVTSTIEDPIYQGTASASLTVLGLTGLEQPLLSGSMSPLANNGTDYGNVTLGRVLTRVFTLSNPGSQPVTLSGNPLVEVEGDHAGDFQVSVLPEAVIPAGGSVSFELRFAPTQPGARTAQVKLACASLANGPITFAVQGFGALPAPRPQTITFAPLAMAYLSQSPLQLTATASSGLPVSLQVISGPATLSQDGLLTLSSAGTVRVEARQAGNGSFAAAPAVLRTITVKADPTTLTLVDLIKTYNGQPQEVGIVGAPASEVTVTYRVGTTFREEPPVNAGSYAVRAVAGAVTKTGTLVINPAPLVVTAENKRRLVGEDNPPITVLFEGFIGEDTLDSVLERPITRSTTATKTSPVGSYPITSSGGVVKPNYRLVHRPGTLVVEGVAGSYEALLRHPTSGLPNGHLALTVPGASRTFTATLRLGQETAPIAWSGSLLLSAQSRLATATVTRLVAGVAYELKVELSLFGELSVEVRRAGELVATAEDGIRLLTLATGQKAAQEGMYTAILEPARPAALTVPAGAGWATGRVDARGQLTLTGRLGDGTSFTASLAADVAEKPGYRLFVQPYVPARRGSHLGGSFTLVPHPRLAARSYVAGSDLSWVKVGQVRDLGYRTDFGPVTTTLRVDPWQAPSTTHRLATRLELGANGQWEVEHSDTGSLTHTALPTWVGVSATNVVTPQANTRKWRMTLTPSTGAYTGSFELLDVTQIRTVNRTVNFSGVLRQTPTLADDLIGAGHYLLPALRTDPNQEQKTGAVRFWRPE